MGEDVGYGLGDVAQGEVGGEGGEEAAVGEEVGGVVVIL